MKISQNFVVVTWYNLHQIEDSSLKIHRTEKTCKDRLEIRELYNYKEIIAKRQILDSMVPGKGKHKFDSSLRDQKDSSIYAMLLNIKFI